MKGSTGIGLANTAARLQQLNDNYHEFDIRNRDSGGVEVVIVMPLRIARNGREDQNNHRR
jgi:sensor histidine kinase YesM